MAFGICIGLLLNIIDESAITTAVLNVVVTSKYILGQLISFSVPLIIIGFIAPSITKMGNNASRLLLLAVCIAYVSSVGAALFSTAAGYALIPHLSIVTDVDGLKELPDMVFELSIPQIMPVMSALVFSIMIGLAAAWNKAKLITGMLEEFQKIVLSIVSRILIPILPLFIGFTFCSLAYEGSITKQLPVFLKVIIIVMIGHYIWMALLYYNRRRLFRKESTGGCEALRTGISDSRWNNVFRSNTWSCSAVCRKGETIKKRYGTVWNSVVC